MNIKDNIIKAVNLFINTNEPDKLREIFIDNEINHKLVEDLYLFLPIIFCRKLLPEINFPNTYIEDFDGKEIRKKFKKEKNFIEIENVVKNLFNDMSSDEILKISSLSSEFKAINEVLLNCEDEYDLSKINLSEMIILR